MKRAKYIGKSYGTGCDKDFVFLEYEYRGHTYEVYENRAKGNEPLSWQHANAQARIDHEIELEEKRKESNFVGESAQEGLDRFFEYLETGVWSE
jgi:hypothetical protein